LIIFNAAAIPNKAAASIISQPEEQIGWRNSQSLARLAFFLRMERDFELDKNGGRKQMMKPIGLRLGDVRHSCQALRPSSKD